MADRANCLLQLGQTHAGYAQAVAALRRLDEPGTGRHSRHRAREYGRRTRHVKQPARAPALSQQHLFPVEQELHADFIAVGDGAAPRCTSTRAAPSSRRAFCIRD